MLFGADALSGPVPETVADGEVGLLADPDDAEGMARHLALLLKDSGRRRAMGEAGRRRVEAYRADRVAGRFLTAIQAALDGRAEGVAAAIAIETPAREGR